MSYDNSGIIFLNNDKKSDKSPDLRGEATINGHKYELAGWKKSSAKCTEFWTLSFAEPREKPQYEGKPSKDGMPF